MAARCPGPDDPGRLSHAKTATGRDLGSSEAVPAAKLGEGDPESVRDRDQGVSFACGVEHAVRRQDGRRQRYDDCLNPLQAGILFHLVRGGQLRYRDVIGPCHRDERVALADGMVAPCVPLAFGDHGDAPLKELGASGGQVKIEGSVWRCHHPQQARIEGLQLVYRRVDEVGSEA